MYSFDQIDVSKWEKLVMTLNINQYATNTIYICTYNDELILNIHKRKRTYTSNIELTLEQFKRSVTSYIHIDLYNRVNIEF